MKGSANLNDVLIYKGGKIDVGDGITQNITSSTNLSFIGDIDASPTVIVTGQLSFDTVQTLSVNGFDVKINDTTASAQGYIVSYNNGESDNKLKVSLSGETTFRRKVEVMGEITATLASGTHVQKDEDTAHSLSPSAGLDVNVDKTISGAGVASTMVTASIYANGNDLTLSDLYWNGHVFAGGHTGITKQGQDKDVLYKNSELVLGNGARVKYGLGGGLIQAVTGTTYSSVNTAVTIKAGVDSSDGNKLLAGGSYVRSSSTVTGTSTLTIDANTNFKNLTGYVVGGSYVDGATTTYQFNGNTVVNMASGVIMHLVGGGMYITDGAKYWQEGSISLTMTGGDGYPERLRWNQYDKLCVEYHDQHQGGRQCQSDVRLHKLEYCPIYRIRRLQWCRYRDWKH